MNDAPSHFSGRETTARASLTSSAAVVAFCWVAAFIGAAAPVMALLRGLGPKSVSGAALMMLVIWGVLPFALGPVAGRLARRPGTRATAMFLVGLAALLGVLGHFAGFVPQVPNATDSLAFIFIPVWQWPMLLLAAVVARVAPAPLAAP